MKRYEIRHGSRMVVITEDPRRFSARLYLNNGDTASLQTWKGKTLAGAQRWATKMVTQAS